MERLKLPQQLRLGVMGHTSAINTGNNGTLGDNCTCGNVADCIFCLPCNLLCDRKNPNK
jgi:hypothetical protein